MYNGKSMMGLVFGLLTVVGEAERRYPYGRFWVVRCICGKEKVVRGASLRNGRSSSCGSCAHKSHGLSRSSTYRTWVSMVERCRSKTSKDYPRYGGSGILVCDRWLNFSNFYEDMGERPAGTSLDRFPQQDGNYEPGNCRWATPKEQALNTKSVRLIEFNGIQDSLNGWATRLGVSRTCMVKRIKKWPLERALTQPRAEEKVFGFGGSELVAVVCTDEKGAK